MPSPIQPAPSPQNIPAFTLPTAAPNSKPSSVTKTSPILSATVPIPTAQFSPVFGHAIPVTASSAPNVSPFDPKKIQEIIKLQDKKVAELAYKSLIEGFSKLRMK